jgi:hypothetical protein
MAKPRNESEFHTVTDPPSQSEDIGHDRIAERAYELYLARGASDGQDWDDWLEAERELTMGRSSRED